MLTILGATIHQLLVGYVARYLEFVHVCGRTELNCIVYGTQGGC